ncbi:uncharacterized protein [Pithys albifrons albifrons]|uniref:uncharacterized protein n=1 Tax=Pithys albifrons albifrons TaxID=3385563 RepID=UPI003A5CF20F
MCCDLLEEYLEKKLHKLRSAHKFVAPLLLEGERRAGPGSTKAAAPPRAGAGAAVGCGRICCGRCCHRARGDRHRSREQPSLRPRSSLRATKRLSPLPPALPCSLLPRLPHLPARRSPPPLPPAPRKPRAGFLTRRSAGGAAPSSPAETPPLLHGGPGPGDPAPAVFLDLFLITERLNMDPETEIKKQVNPFFCYICKVWCASALNLQTHFHGFKHKMLEEALKSHGIVKTASGPGDQVKTPVKLPDYVQIEPERLHGQTLEEQLNTCKDSEPALGLNYIIEYRSRDNVPSLYECQLCCCKTGLNSMFMHVCGSKHRLAYLKHHYPEIAESDEVKGKGSELNRKVRQVALTIEKKEGRKQIKVVTEAPTMRKRWQESFNADDSPSKAKVQHVDALLSNAEKADSKNKDGELPDLVQDEKSVQEEKGKCQKEQAKPDEKVEPNKAIESSKDNSERCETSKQLQEENKGVEQEHTANPEEFTSQEELLGYLQSFEILNEDDASFILKVTQTLTDALVEYRQQAASNKDLVDVEYNGETTLECSTERSDPTSADVSDSDTDYSSSRSAKKSLSVNGEDEPQNPSTGSSDTAYENNVMTEFLNSVRNMSVEEVTATLHKIAAANPAFRGIDIPNVIRILAESGTLRRARNGSTQ